MSLHKTLLTAAVAVLITGLALAGCTGVAPSAAPAEEAVALTFMHFNTPDTAPPGDPFQTTVAQWQQDHANVTLNQDVMSHDEFETKFRTLAAAGELPDMFAINGNMITSLGDAGALADFAPDLAADAAWKDTLLPGSLPEFVRGDKLYAIPSGMLVTHLIYYNADIFKEVGIDKFPDTWDGFKDAIIKLKEAGYTPIALGDKGKWLLRDPLFGTLANRYTGTDWHTKLQQHEAKWTDPEFVAALAGFKELIDLGAFNADATSIDNMQQRSMYYNKEAAMFIEGNWAAADVDRDAPPDVAKATEIAIFPAVPGGIGQGTDTVTIAGWSWGVNSKATPAQRSAALSLINALSDAEYGRKRLESGNLAAQKVADYDKSKLPPTAVKVFDFIAGTTGIPHLTIPFPPSIDDVLATGLQDMLVGQVTPEELAAKLQAEWDNYK